MARFDFDTLLGCVKRMITTDKYIMNKWYGYIDPEDFFPNSASKDEEALKKILKMLISHHKQNRWDHVTIQTLHTEVRSMPDGEMREHCISLVDKMLYDENVAEKAKDPGCIYLFLDFLKMIALHIWARNFSKLYAKGDITGAIEDMKNFIPTLDKISLKDYKTMDPLRIYEKLKDRNLNTLNNFKIGIPALDGETGAGWYEPSTLNVFVGATGTGKSMMTMNLICQAIMQSRYVHVAAVEDRDQTVETRLLAAVTNIPIAILKSRIDTLTTEEVNRILKAQGLINKFVRVDYIYGESVDFIHNEKININKQRLSEGLPEYEIDVIDYTGHIAINSFGDKMHEKFRNAYAARKDFALKYNKFCFDFVQVNREGNKKNASGSGMLTEGDFAGAYDISMVCDTIITINRSEEQQQQNMATLYVTKGREGGKGLKIDLKTEFDKGKFDFKSVQQPSVF